MAGLVAAAQYGDQFQIVLALARRGAADVPARDRCGRCAATSTLAIAATLLGVFWIGLALAHAVLLRELDHGDGLLIDVLLATFIGDTGAYFGGRL